MSREMIRVPEPVVDGKLYYDCAERYAYAQIPNPCSYCHAADLLELPNGDILCCWFAGEKGEGYSDVSIWLSRLAADSGQWTQPVRVSDDPERSEQNPSLFLDDRGVITLIYASFRSKAHELRPHANLQYTSKIVCKRSTDNGFTWSETETLFDDPGSFCRQKIQVLKNGRWLFGNWICFDDDSLNGSDITVIRLSDDRGKNWQTVQVPACRGCVHCNIVERDGGHLLAFFRSRGSDSIYISHSYDYGSSWSAPEKTELPNNNSSISAIGLASGSIAVAFNDCRFGDDRAVSRWPNQRSPLTLAISDNEGRSFDYRRVADPCGGYCGRKNAVNNRRSEYPVILESNDRRHIFAAYTWGRRTAIRFLIIDEAWIRGELEKDEGLQYTL